MRISKRRVLIGGIAIAALLTGVGFRLTSASGAVTASAAGFNKIQLRLLDGLAATELGQAGPQIKSSSVSYFPNPADDQCALKLGSNVKVNQNCLNLSDPSLQGRSQAQNETAIAEDPLNSKNLVAGYNDYRRGDGTCGASYTLDGGLHWNDATLPNGFVNGGAFGEVARQYMQAGGDPSVAWDSKGNAYYDCQMFMRGAGTTNNPDQSSGFFVFRSTQNNGASWNFTGRPVVQAYTTTGFPFLDKPYMTIDNHVGSPFQDRIYVTWTTFAADGSAIIYEAFSNNYGESFGSPVVVSSSSSLCPNSFGVPTTITTCNENQFSDPFTGSDGSLYVVYSNFNNSTASATDNHNQILLVKSTDGGASFGAPVLVANYNDLPDCATYQGGQDAGRACVPEQGASMLSVFRAANYASGAVVPSNASQLVVTFGSYISADSNPSNGCVPNGFSAFGNNDYTGVKTAGACNNKILESVSTNGGTSFNGTVTDPTTLSIVSSASGQKRTDQWFAWEAFTSGGKLAVSYYDRQYGKDESNASMDISLSGSTTTLSTFSVMRVTSASMPPPTEFPDAQGNSVFFGDYSGITAASSAYPLWMDTRSTDLFLCPGTGAPGVPPAVCGAIQPSGLVANDQDVFSSKVSVP
ncbi:MAG: exo-alpha-sialidase [Candidatus Dormibacteria bacterium]